MTKSEHAIKRLKQVKRIKLKRYRLRGAVKFIMSIKSILKQHDNKTNSN